MNRPNKAAIATFFLTMCASGQVRKAYERYVSNDFRHHNAYFPEDRESLLLAMEHSALVEPGKTFTVKQTIESNDRVAVYSYLRREQAAMEMAVVHILRFEDNKIVEMWDLAQPIPKDSPNRLGMF